MLNETRVLKYIKTNLGFPFHTIEIEDDDMIDYVKEFTLREFSYYIPEVRKMGLNLTLEANKVPGRSNEFYIDEFEGKEILSIKDIYFSSSSLYYHGHPPFGADVYGTAIGSTPNSIKEWALSVEMSGMAKKFSSFDYTFEFQHPNIVRISPNPVESGEGTVTVEYERVQSDDFSGIPNEFQNLFMELALADIMVTIGRIRKKYGGQMRTPYGEIPIEAEIGDEGKEKKRELIELLKTNMIPNITVDFA